MEDNSGKKFSLQDWVMKRAANQSASAMPSQTLRSPHFEKMVEEDVAQEDEIVIRRESREVDTVEVEMKSVSNGSAVSMSASSKPVIEQPVSKKAEVMPPSAASNPTANSLQQLQVVRLLSDLSDRLRQSEKEREVLWKEVEICRKQIADMSVQTDKKTESVSSLEVQMNQREVFVKELVEKQIDLEQKLKEQLSAMESSKQEQAKLQESLREKVKALETKADTVLEATKQEQVLVQEKLKEQIKSIETATGSAIVRVEDAIAENMKLNKRVEQLSQDKARLMRKLETVEETLAQTQETLKAKALVLLTDQALAQRTAMPQTPAWTGDDTLKVQQAVQNHNSPVTSLKAALEPKPAQPNLLVVTILTAILAGAAAWGAIWMMNSLNKTPEASASVTSEDSTSIIPQNSASLSQDEMMKQAAIMANQIEPGALEAGQDEILADTRNDDVKSAEASVAQAVDEFNQTRPTQIVTERIKADRSLPPAVKKIENEARAGNANAQHDLAAIYTAGHGGVKLDYTKAAQWFEESAYQGNANAQYNLGVLYHQGLGVEKNIPKAIQLYRVASVKNHPEALYNLGIAYVEGVGVEYNPTIASHYFEKSAELGITEAAYNLGLIHDNGLLGESQPDEAIFWYQLAAGNKNPDAIKSLQELQNKLSLSEADVARIVTKIAADKPAFMDEAGAVRMPDTPTATPATTSQEIVASNVAEDGAINPSIVSQIQEQLGKLGFYQGLADGNVTPDLSKAIEAYQKANNIKVDGIASDDLLVRMLVDESTPSF